MALKNLHLPSFRDSNDLLPYETTDPVRETEARVIITATKNTTMEIQSSLKHESMTRIILTTRKLLQSYNSTNISLVFHFQKSSFRSVKRPIKSFSYFPGLVTEQWHSGPRGAVEGCHQGAPQTRSRTDLGALVDGGCQCNGSLDTLGPDPAVPGGRMPQQDIRS